MYYERREKCDYFATMPRALCNVTAARFSLMHVFFMTSKTAGFYISILCNNKLIRGYNRNK